MAQNLASRPGAKRRIVLDVKDTELDRHLLGVAPPWASSGATQNPEGPFFEGSCLEIFYTKVTSEDIVNACVFIAEHC